jgi:hypothetical protein
VACFASLRRELGERGYDAFLKFWSKEAHLIKYFDFLRQAAIKKFGKVPWDESALNEPGSELVAEGLKNAAA